MHPHRDTRPAVWIFLLALVLRCVWVTLQGSPQPPESGLTYPDEFVYWHLAESLASGEGLRDEFGYRATYMPLYPAFLAPFTKLPNGLLYARLLQAFIGAAAVLPVYLIALAIAGRRAAVLAALLTALDPFLAFGMSHLILTETIFTTLLYIAMWLTWPSRPNESTATPSHPLIGGAAWAAAIYTRPSVAGFIPVWLLVRSWRGRPRYQTVLHSAGIAVYVLIFLFPWAVRNRMLLGEWCWLTTRDGISLYDGLGPNANGGSNLALTKTMPAAQGLSELEWDRYFRDKAWRAAADHPMRVLRLAGVKFLRTWSLVPNEPNSRTPLKMIVSLIWMIGVLVLAVVGAIRWRCPSTAILLLLPALYFTALHMIVVGSVRYRVPVMPALYILAGLALAAGYAQRRRGATDA
jgi:4-amino-4-deoxy-L-arabinose transferase-like glycosyltransferase